MKPKKTRPSGTLPADYSNLVLRIAGAAVLLALVGYIGWNYSSLPERLITGFDERGIPEVRARWRIWLLPGISAVLYALLTLLSCRPQQFWYPVKVTDANRERIYRLSRRTLTAVTLLIVSAYAYAGFNEVEAALGRTPMSPRPLYATALAVVLIPVIALVRIARGKA